MIFHIDCALAHALSDGPILDARSDPEPKLERPQILGPFLSGPITLRSYKTVTQVTRYVLGGTPSSYDTTFPASLLFLVTLGSYLQIAQIHVLAYISS